MHSFIKGGRCNKRTNQSGKFKGIEAFTYGKSDKKISNLFEEEGLSVEVEQGDGGRGEDKTLLLKKL